MNINNKSIEELMAMLRSLYDAQDDLNEKVKILEEYILHRNNQEKRKRSEFVNKYREYRP